MNEAKHVLAVLRRIIGLKQKEFGALVGRSLATIQGIEYDEMDLSPGLAEDVARQTGIDIRWLLANDLTKPPINHWGKPYAKGDFEKQQAWINRKLGDQSDLDWTKIMVNGSVGDYCGIAASALKKDRFVLFNYKYHQLLRELEKEFGTDLAMSRVFDAQGKLKRDPIKELDSVIDETLNPAPKKTTSRRRPR